MAVAKGLSLSHRRQTSQAEAEGRKHWRDGQRDDETGCEFSTRLCPWRLGWGAVVFPAPPEAPDPWRLLSFEAKTHLSFLCIIRAAQQ